MRSLLLAVVLGLATTSARAQSAVTTPSYRPETYGSLASDAAKSPQPNNTEAAKNSPRETQLFIIYLTVLEFEPAVVKKVVTANETKDPLVELIKKASESTFVLEVATKHGDLKKSLKTLQRDATVRVLAEPTMVTADGRTCSFRSGGELVLKKTMNEPTDAKVEFGTWIDVTPLLKDEGRIQLDLNAKVVELEQADVEPEQRQAPLLRRRQINTGLELKLDQTLVVGSLNQQRINPRDDQVVADERRPRVALYLISVERIDSNE